MTGQSGDSWTAGDAYEAYMGRWSRVLAKVFLDWLRPAPEGHWLEVGCGTGALTAAILDACRPASVVACDPSEPFVEHASRRVSGVSSFEILRSADALPERAGGFDAVVSGLVLNFVPEPRGALERMRERARRGGTVAAYVWDYASGVDLLTYFWEEAILLDPGAASVDERQRFGHWNEPALSSAFQSAGFADVETCVLEIPTTFSDFEDYWQPFLGRSGPAPAYVAALDPTQRALLRARLEQRLARERGKPIPLRARALSAHGVSR
jgi:SAM-dependent methyltransferase